MTDYNFAFSAFGFDISVVSHWIIPTEFHPVLFDIYKLTFSKVTILQHCCQAGWQLWGISIFLVSFFLQFFATPICYTKYIDIRRNVKDKVGQKYLLKKIPLFCLARVVADKNKGIHLFLCIGHNSGPVTRLPAPSGSFHTNANAHTADGGLSSIHWKHTTN